MGAGAEKNRAHRARSGESRQQTGEQTEADEFAGLRQNKAQDISRLRAERHANSDFPRALNDAVSHYPVNSDRGNHERDRRRKR